MTPAFILKLALSFLIGGAWVSLGIALAERRGARFGGLVIGFPSTILFTLFFIGWSQSTQAAVRAAAVIPAAHGINALFLLAAVSLLRHGLRAALSVGLGVWFCLALVLVAAKFDGFSTGLLIYFTLLALSYSLLGRALPDGPDLPRPDGPIRSTPALILGRGALVGGIIALAVLLTKAAGPLVGGVFAIFPAAFLGTLVATYISRGAAFSASVMRAALLGGISVVVYAAAVRLTYPQLGLGWGTAASTAAALGSTILIRAVTMKSRT